MDWTIVVGLAVGIPAGLITICGAAICIDRRLFRGRQQSKYNVTIVAEKGGIVNFNMPTILNYPDGWIDTSEPQKKQAFEIAEGYLNRGEYAQAARSFEACLAVATTDSERASLHSYITLCFVILGRPGIAEGHCLEAEMAAGEADDLEGLAVASVNLATLHFMRQGPQATLYFDKALDLSRQAGHKEAEVSALLGSVFCLLMTAVDDKQSRATAWQKVQTALSIAEDASYEEGQAFSLTTMSLLHLLEGQPQQAMTLSSKALSIARQTGQPFSLANVLLYPGIVSLESGHTEQAFAIFQEGLTTAKDIGYRLGEAIYLSLSGHVLERMGQPPQALELVQQAQQIFEELGADVFKEIVSRDVQRLSNKDN